MDLSGGRGRTPFFCLMVNDDSASWQRLCSHAEKRQTARRDSPITSLFSKLSSLVWLALRICILMNSIFVLLS